MNNESNMVIRNRTYDNLRIIATILVLLGHCTYYIIVTDYGGVDYSRFAENKTLIYRLFDTITMIIYLFHMPLFMALSGALFLNSLKRGKYSTLKELLKEKGKRLMLPFLVVSICYSFPLKLVSGYYSESHNLFSDFLIGQILLQGDSHLWYCFVLFLIFIVVYILEKYFMRDSIIKLGILLIFHVLSFVVEIVLFSKVLNYAFWFYMGVFFEEKRERFEKAVEKKCFWISATVLIPIMYSCYDLLCRQDDFSLVVVSKVIKIGLTSVLCLCMYGIAYVLTKTKIMKTKICRLLRNDSYGIYLYSDSWNYVLLLFGTTYFGEDIFASNVGVLAFYCIRFCVTLVVSIMVTEILRKCKVKYMY